MPKISQTTIDQIRDRADIVDIISQEVNLKRKGIDKETADEIIGTLTDARLSFSNLIYYI